MTQQKEFKSILKTAGLSFSLVSAMLLVACGDDSSSSGTFSMEKSFEMVLEKAEYSFNKKDSTFKRIVPVCKEGSLGNLVGPEDTDEWDTVTYKAHEHKGIVTVKNGNGDPVKYDVDEDSFPVGFWADPDNSSKAVQYGYALTKKDMMNRVIRYEGSCFMKDYYSVLGKEVKALEDMDKQLTSFYGRFQDQEVGEVDQKQMLSDIRAPECDELTLYDGLVKLNVEDFNESSGKIVIKYEKRTCDISFNIRYAYEQEDCAAAFEDYKNDKNADKKFNFNEYAFDVIYGGDDDDFCIKYLVLDVQKKIGVNSQKSVNSKEFARDLVKLMVGGLK